MNLRLILVFAVAFSVACGSDDATNNSADNGAANGETGDNNGANSGANNGDDLSKYTYWKMELSGFEGRDDIPKVAGGYKPMIVVQDDLLRVFATSLPPEMTTATLHFDPRIVGEAQPAIEFRIGTNSTAESLTCVMVDGDPVQVTYTPNEVEDYREATFEGSIVCNHDAANPIEGTVTGWFTTK